MYSSTSVSRQPNSCRFAKSSRSLPAQAVRSPSHGRAGPGSRPSSARGGTTGAVILAYPNRTCNTGVPKTLGVASCAGCGARSFFNADGVCLKPCTACKQVYYCSALCAQVDGPSHKAVCRYHVTGQWTPAGIRPAADCWIVNKSMAVARDLLKQQHKHNSLSRPRSTPAAMPGGLRASSRAPDRWSAVEQMDTVFEVCHDWGHQLDLQERLEQQLALVRLEEQQAERKQQQLEQLANQGMDGPRPCLCANGIEMGAKRHRRASARQSTPCGPVAWQYL